MDFDFEKITDFAMNINKLDLANLVEKVMDEIVGSRFFLPSENYTKSMVSGLEKPMDFAMDINKLHLANLVEKVIDKIMEYLVVFFTSASSSKFDSIVLSYYASSRHYLLLDQSLPLRDVIVILILK